MIKKFLKETLQVITVALLIGGAIAGCGVQSNPPEGSHGPEALIFVGNNENGMVSVIEHNSEGNSVAKTIPLGSGDVGDMAATTESHIFVNVTDNDQVAAIDPVVDGLPELRNFLPVGERPVHIYRDPEGTRVWVMNDGDATGGTCKTSGFGGAATSSVTVIQNHEVGNDEGSSGIGGLGEVIATICVGRGHHKAAFSFPTSDAPMVPHRTFVSNISDGTISVIDNEPASDNYLKVIATIDLCDPDRQANGCDADLSTSNSASPHGIDYSPVSGKIYNANAGYGTVAVIDPVTNTIATIDIGYSNKLHISPEGRFVAIKGTDKTSDTDHVIGKLTVINVADNSFIQVNIRDVHPDSFEFTPDGSKLYVTSATTGSDVQKANLKKDVLLVFDTSALSDLITLIKEIQVGEANGSHRSLAIHEHDGIAEHLFVPNPADGTVSVVDIRRDEVEDTVTVGGEPSSILVFPFEGSDSH